MPAMMPLLADAGDDLVEIGMQERLAAADGDDGGAQRAEPVNAAEHFLGGNGIREIVVFVAIGAGEIAAAHGDDMDQQGMAGGKQAFREETNLAQLAVRGTERLADFFSRGHGVCARGAGRITRSRPHLA